MSKIAILGDVHFGCRNRNLLIEKWQRRFFQEFFWPKMDELGIDTVLQTGDYFDSRKWVNIQTMAFHKEVFVKPAQDRNTTVHVIIGNHDIPLKYSLENSSVMQLLGNEDYFYVWDEIQTREFDDCKITFMPWICKENSEESLRVIQEGGDVLFGHFEMNGFIMHPGSVSHSGFNASQFSNWDKVISGHYHTQSENANIQYVGTPYQMTWNDWSTKHGFWVFDTFDKSMVFYENPFKIFYKLFWEDGFSKEIPNVQDCYVKVQVEKKTDFELFEKFLDSVNFLSPYELKVLENYDEFHSENVNELIQLASTQELIEEYISEVATLSNKENITKTMLQIYKEAQEVD